MNLPDRRTIRLQGFSYAAGIYFVTICANERKAIFGEIRHDTMHMNDLGRIVESSWLDLPNHHPGVVTDAYAVMPNHFHGILGIFDADIVGTAGCAATGESGRGFGKLSSGTLPVIIRSFKSATTRLIRQITSLKSVWQRGYHEHVIRNESDLNLTRHYISMNLVKWSLDHENPDHVS